MFGTTRHNPEVSGIFPKAFVTQVCCLDRTAQKAKKTIEFIFQCNKNSWLEAKEYDTRSWLVKLNLNINCTPLVRRVSRIGKLGARCLRN